MCGRYHLSEKAREHIKGLVEEQSEFFVWNYHGDIYPTDRAVVITGRTPGMCVEEMKWGFPEKTLLINARAENVFERRTFSDSIRKRRCVIPASHFYEWDKDKTKVTFTLPSEELIYMAGFYDIFDGKDRFIILTTAANESMSPVHDRMPLILAEDQLQDWIYRDDKTRAFLSIKSPLLNRSQEYEQLSLFKMTGKED